jgi:hypothetical protein
VRNSLSVLRHYQDTWLVQHMASVMDPVGMMVVLLESIGWLMENKAIRFGRFYWRPDNGRVHRLFLQMRAAASRAHPEGESLTTHKYFFLPLEKMQPQVASCDRRICVRPAAKDQFAELSRLLYYKLGRTTFLAESLQPEHLELEGVGAAYRRFGLERQRTLLVAESGGAILGAAAAETASPGLNFSFYLNRVQFCIFQAFYSSSKTVEILRALLRAAIAFYRRKGACFLVVLWDEREPPLMEALGLAPLKRYACLTLSRELENAAALNSVKAYYRDKLMRKARGQVKG